MGPEHAALFRSKRTAGVLAGVIGCDLGPEVFPWLCVGNSLERAELTVTPGGGFAVASGQLRTTGT